MCVADSKLVISMARGKPRFEEEIIMKSFLLFIAFLCAVTLSSGSTPSVTNYLKIGPAGL